MSAPSVSARSRASFSSVLCRPPSIVSRTTRSFGVCASAWSAACGAMSGIFLRAVGTSSCLACAISASLNSPLPAMRSSTRSRASFAFSGKRSGRRNSGDCGSATEQRRLAEREPPRLLAEIGKRGRADAFEIAAIRRQREIKAEDLVLAQRPFELERPHRLPDLGVERAVPARLQQAGDLHGDGRAARDDAAMRDELVRRAHDGERIDARMGEEPLVLIGEQRLEEDRIDLLARGRKPPAAFAGEIGPEQLAVAIEHQGRDFEIAPERRRPEGLERADDGSADRRDQPHRADRGEGGAASPRARPGVPCPITRCAMRAGVSPSGRSLRPCRG